MSECSDCRFWERLDKFVGDCRRYPPKIHPTKPHDQDAEHEWGVFPAVAADDSCGEWESLWG